MLDRKRSNSLPSFRFLETRAGAALRPHSNEKGSSFPTSISIFTAAALPAEEFNIENFAGI